MQTFISLVIAILGAFLAYLHTIQPMFASGWSFNMTLIYGLVVQTGLLIIGIAGIFTAAGYSLPAWLSALITDIDHFIKAIQPAAKKIGGIATRTLMVIAFPVLLAFVVLANGCAGTPCGDLRQGLQIAQDGVVAANVVCPCLAFDAAAEAACKVAAEGLSISVDAANEVYAAFCMGGDAGPDGGSDGGSDGGVSLSLAKLHTQEQFTAYFHAHGAMKRGVTKQ